MIHLPEDLKLAIGKYLPHTDRLMASTWLPSIVIVRYLSVSLTYYGEKISFIRLIQLASRHVMLEYMKLHFKCGSSGMLARMLKDCREYLQWTNRSGIILSFRVFLTFLPSQGEMRELCDVDEINLTLDLKSTAVTDVSALASCSNLHTLDLRGTRVTDVSALAACPNLLR